MHESRQTLRKEHKPRKTWAKNSGWDRKALLRRHNLRYSRKILTEGSFSADLALGMNGVGKTLRIPVKFLQVKGRRIRNNSNANWKRSSLESICYSLTWCFDRAQAFSMLEVLGWKRYWRKIHNYEIHKHIVGWDEFLSCLCHISSFSNLQAVHGVSAPSTFDQSNGSPG